MDLRGAIGALALGFGATLAHAEPADSAFVLEYAAPPDCPAAAVFVQAVRARSHRPWVVAPEAGPRVRVHIAGDADRARGTLWIALQDGQESGRDIPEAACSEVVSSMAVIAAMILDTAQLDAPPPGTPAPAPAPNPDPSDKVDPLVRTAFPERLRDVAAPSTPAASAADSGRSALMLGGALGLGPMSGVAPSATWAFSGGPSAAIDTGTLLSPEVRVLFTFAQNAETSTTFGNARFRLLAATGSVCPLRRPSGQVPALRPCLALELGDLHGKGESTINPRNEHMLWFGAGPALRFESRIAASTNVEIEGHLLRLVRDDRFVFEPNVVAHDVPEYVFGVRFGVAFSTPVGGSARTQ